MIVLQMSGFPGSGKSTISKEIAKKINAVVIDKDILKSSMLESGISDDVASKLSYDVLFDLAKFYLEQEKSVILDSPCYFDEIIEKGTALSNTYNATYKFLECSVASFEIIDKRVNLRQNMTSQIKKPSLKGFENAKLRAKHPVNGYMKLDTSDLDVIDFDSILEYLEETETASSEFLLG